MPIARNNHTICNNPIPKKTSAKKALYLYTGLFNGGDEEDRTPDLRIANASLSQLSYTPTTGGNMPLNIIVCQQNYSIISKNHINRAFVSFFKAKCKKQNRKKSLFRFCFFTCILSDLFAFQNSGINRFGIFAAAQQRTNFFITQQAGNLGQSR